MNKHTPDHPDLALATALHRSVLQLGRRLRSGRGEGALSPSSLLVLGLIHRNAAITGVELATELAIKPQSLTRLLAAMEAKGFIRKKTDPEDGRKSRLHLTTAGAKALEGDLHERRLRLARALEQSLSTQEKVLLHVGSGIIDKLAAAMGTDDADASGER